MDDKTVQYEKENEDIPLAKQRYEICKGCEHFSSLKFCGKCGCFMPLKVRIDTVSCPIQKW